MHRTFLTQGTIGLLLCQDCITLQNPKPKGPKGGGGSMAVAIIRAIPRAGPIDFIAGLGKSLCRRQGYLSSKDSRVRAIGIKECQSVFDLELLLGKVDVLHKILNGPVYLILCFSGAIVNLGPRRIGSINNLYPNLYRLMLRDLQDKRSRQYRWSYFFEKPSAANPP